MRKLLPTMLLCLLALPAISQEKQPSDNPLSAFTKRVYGFQKGILLRSAEKMPEEDYNFKPTETVQLRPDHRTLGRRAIPVLFQSARREKPRAEDRADQDLEGRSDRRSQDRLRLLRQGLRWHDRRVWRSNSEAVRNRYAEARRPELQQCTQYGTLRKPRHLHEDQGHRSSYQRAGANARTKAGETRITAKEVKRLCGRALCPPASPNYSMAASQYLRLASL